jgi:hypothetical protein
MYGMPGQPLSNGVSSPEVLAGTTGESLESLQDGLDRARKESGSDRSSATRLRLSSMFGAAEQILASARAALNRRT